MSNPLSANVVRLHRIKGLEPIDCQIHRSTQNAIIASELSDSLDLDGLCLIPTKTIKSFDRDYARFDFYNAAVGTLVLTEETSSFLGQLTGDLSSDIEVLSKSGAFVAFHMEFDDADVCFIGKPMLLINDLVSLARVDSHGMWIEEPLEVSVKSITKIEVATRYLLAIARAVARLPSVKSR
jgi:hypothetical protein